MLNPVGSGCCFDSPTFMSVFSLLSFVYPRFSASVIVGSCPVGFLSIFHGDLSSPSGISDVSDPPIPSSSRQTFMTGHAIWGFEENFLWRREDRKVSPVTIYYVCQNTPCRRLRFLTCSANTDSVSISRLLFVQLGIKVLYVHRGSPPLLADQNIFMVEPPHNIYQAFDKNFKAIEYTFNFRACPLPPPLGLLHGADEQDLRRTP